MVVGEAIALGTKELANLEYSNPNWEIYYILSNILNSSKSHLMAYQDEEISKEDEEKYLEVIERRRSGEPLQYIFGKTEFYGEEFIVLENVLIPRVDTEVSIEVLKQLFKENTIKNFLEIGSGTGIVSIIMAKLFPSTSFTATDISDYALKNTLLNIQRFGLNNIEQVKSDIFENIDKKFDLIYSNPPYIRSSEISNLQIEVRDHEPILALDGGDDGLYFYKKIIEDASEYLNEDGILVFEIGYDQSDDLKKLLNGYKTNLYYDLNGQTRVISARR